MRDTRQLAEEILDVDQIPDHVARDHVVEGPRDRQALHVSADEVEVRVAAPRVEERREREVDPDAPGGLKGGEERSIAATEVEHARPWLHLVADHPVEVLVVVAVASSCRGTLRREGFEVTAYPAARAIIETARAVGRRLRGGRALTFHERWNDRLIAPRTSRG